VGVLHLVSESALPNNGIEPTAQAPYDARVRIMKGRIGQSVSAIVEGEPVGSWQRWQVVLVAATGWVAISFLYSQALALIVPRGRTSPLVDAAIWLGFVLGAWTFARLAASLGAAGPVWIGVGVGQLASTLPWWVIVLAGSHQTDAAALSLTLGTPLLLTLAVSGAAYFGGMPKSRRDVDARTTERAVPRPDSWD
jgi:hypothetical protein